MRVFRVYVTTAPGVGRLLREEMQRLLGRPVRMGSEESGDESGCLLEGVHESEVWRLCAFSRLASGVRIRLGEAKPTAKFALFDRHVRTLPWEVILPTRSLQVPPSPSSSPPRGAARISAVCHESKLYHSDALSQRLRDYLERKRLILSTEEEQRRARHLHATARMEQENSSESIEEEQPREEGSSEPSLDDPALALFIRLQGDQAQVSVDAGGELLSRRGYRTRIGEAPIRENLAAACLEAMGYRGQAPLWDPFCGSGTLLCEALLRCASLQKPIAANQLVRPLRHFAFQQWRTFPPAHYHEWHAREVQASQQAFQDFIQQTPVPIRFIGSDISRPTLRAAQGNWNTLLSAGGSQRPSAWRKQVHWWAGDFEKVADRVCAQWPEERPIIVGNLPYGVRLQQHLNSVYNRFNRMVRDRASQWEDVYVLDGSADAHFLAIASSHGVSWKSILHFSSGGTGVRLLQYQKEPPSA